MSNTRKFIEHVLSEDGNKARSSIQKAMNEKVAEILESKKLEIAGGALVSEEKVMSEEHIQIIEELEKTERKINKLKEEIALLEASACEMSDDEDDEDDDSDEKLEKKKKKLKKKEKKMKKLKEAYALLESEGVDDEGEWSDEENEEEDEDEE